MSRVQKIQGEAANKVSRTQGLLFSIVFLASIFAYPLSSYLSEFLRIQSNLISIALRAVTVGLVFFYLAFLLYHKLFRPVPIFYIFLIFWCLYGVRIMYDTIEHGWMLGRPAFEYYLFGFVISFGCTIPFFVPVKVPVRWMENASLLILLILNMLGAYNLLTADAVFMERLGGNEKLNPILFGMQAALLISICVTKLVSPSRLLVFKALLVVSAILGTFNLAASASKSPVLFLGFVLLALSFYSIRIGNKKAVVLIIGLIAAIISIILMYGLQDILVLLFSRFSEIGDDASSQERWDMVSGGFLQFLQSPLFGSFLEEKIYQEYPHNLVIEAFMATGVLGGSLFLIYYLLSAKSTFQYLIASGFGFLSLQALLTITISLFSGGLTFSTDFWVAMAVVNSQVYFFRRNRMPATFNCRHSIKAT